LPLANLFQRVIDFCAAARGAETWLVADPTRIVALLPSIRPSVFVATPRFFEKFHEGLVRQVHSRGVLAAGLLEWALRQRVVSDGRRAPFRRLQAGLADRCVLRRLRQVLGGEVRFLISGSAPLPVWLIEHFEAMGLPVLEAYGLSENVVPVALSRLADRQPGTVGRPVGDNELRLAPDGEVLVRGGGVFNGYLGQPAHGAPLDAQGFLHTGDLGRFDIQGRLQLIGRKCEVFKTSTGRKVAPAAWEAALKRIHGIDQALVMGAGRKLVVALVLPTREEASSLPDEAARLVWCAAIARQAAIAVAPGERLRPAGLLVRFEPLSLERGEITPNLKLRRAAIEAGLTSALDALYGLIERGGDFKLALGGNLYAVRCTAGATG
jgi:long-chain acyl-CoA synthetase